MEQDQNKQTSVSQPAKQAEQSAQLPKKKNKAFPIVLIALVIVGGTFGITKYLHAQHHEETDDAQIDANISPVIPRIAGYVTDIRVKDNQPVKKGDTLLVLDNRSELIQLQQAQAALSTAQSNLNFAEATVGASKANIATYQSNISTIDAQIASAQITLRRAKQDYERYANMIKNHTITQQQYEQVEAAKETAERQLQVLTDQKNTAYRQTTAATSQSSATERQINVANATIQQRIADVDNAKLNLSYTFILAQQDGHVSKINVQLGQYLQPGQMLFSVVADDDPWVVANFKETQLTKMHVGQKVYVHIDAYPSHTFEARVGSLSPATGARFALLPPDNASGNFVKVVQRLPVRIEFTQKDIFLKELRPGMNVDVDVNLD